LPAFEEPGNENKGVVQVDGRMVLSGLHAEMAGRRWRLPIAIAKTRPS